MIYDTPNLSSGLDDALVDVAGTVPAIIPFTLLFIFGVIFIGGSLAQKRRTGYADMPFWCLLASSSIFIISLMMTLVEGLMPLSILAPVLALTIISGAWFFMSGRNSGF